MHICADVLGAELGAMAPTPRTLCYSTFCVAVVQDPIGAESALPDQTFASVSEQIHFTLGPFTGDACSANCKETPAAPRSVYARVQALAWWGPAVTCRDARRTAALQSSARDN